MTERLDVELLRRGLSRSRTKARTAIADGAVRVNGIPAAKPSQQVTPGDYLEIEEGDLFVSRAAHKLLGALSDSCTLVPSRVLDAGASTGGFTQVLLQAGAQRVYAVDVGHGQLVEELRADHRVVVHERTNLRDLSLEHVEAEPVDLVVADVSFISLRLLVEPLLNVLRPGGVALLLVKPQFEVGRGGLDTHGVVRSEQARLAAVASVADAASAHGWHATWRGQSRLPGESGNVEYFLKLVAEEPFVTDAD